MADFVYPRGDELQDTILRFKLGIATIGILRVDIFRLDALQFCEQRLLVRIYFTVDVYRTGSLFNCMVNFIVECILSAMKLTMQLKM